MTLYRSELQPTGARYVPLAQVELPGGGGSEVIEMADKKANLKDASAKEAKAKDAALESAVTQIEREFGEGSLMRLGDKGTVKVDSIPTGVAGARPGARDRRRPARPDRRDLRPGVLR